MTRWLQAAKQVSGPLTKPTKPTKPPAMPPPQGVSSVLSVLSEGGQPVLRAPRPRGSNPEITPPRQKPEIFPYGQAFGGRPKTWTGRVVSLEEWRGLSAWDKRGPDGRLFCGICRVWIAAGGNACGVAGCPIGGDA